MTILFNQGTGKVAHPMPSGYAERYSFRAVSIGVKYARDSQIVTGYGGIGFFGFLRTYTGFPRDV